MPCWVCVGIGLSPCSHNGPGSPQCCKPLQKGPSVPFSYWRGRGDSLGGNSLAALPHYAKICFPQIQIIMSDVFLEGEL